MQLKVIVYADDRFFQGQSSITIAGPYTEAFQPLKTTDEPIMALISGDKLAASVEVRKVVKFREETAKEIAEALTEQLLEQMKKQDTINGYPIERG